MRRPICGLAEAPRNNRPAIRPSAAESTRPAGTPHAIARAASPLVKASPASAASSARPVYAMPTSCPTFNPVLAKAPPPSCARRFFASCDPASSAASRPTPLANCCSTRLRTSALMSFLAPVLATRPPTAPTTAPGAAPTPPAGAPAAPPAAAPAADTARLWSAWPPKLPRVSPAHSPKEASPDTDPLNDELFCSGSTSSRCTRW